jgi:hypothetical protein
VPIPVANGTGLQPQRQPKTEIPFAEPAASLYLSINDPHLISDAYVLPGTRTIPEQISQNKDPYYKALESADRANAEARLDLSEMEKLLESLLATQLLSVIDAARSSK